MQDRGIDVHFLRLSMLHFKRETFKIILKISTISSVFPGGSMVKNLPASTGNSRLSPWVRKIPWRRKWQPTTIFLPGKFHGWRSLVSHSPWDHKELDTTERLHFLSLVQGGVQERRRLLPSALPAEVAQARCWDWALSRVGTGPSVYLLHFRPPGLAQPSRTCHPDNTHLAGFR